MGEPERTQQERDEFELRVAQLLHEILQEVQPILPSIGRSYEACLSATSYVVAEALFGLELLTHGVRENNPTSEEGDAAVVSIIANIEDLAFRTFESDDFDRIVQLSLFDARNRGVEVVECHSSIGNLCAWARTVFSKEASTVDDLASELKRPVNIKRFTDFNTKLYNKIFPYLAKRHESAEAIEQIAEAKARATYFLVESGAWLDIAREVGGIKAIAFCLVVGHGMCDTMLKYTEFRVADA